MIPWIKQLLYDPASFANFIRAGVFIAGEAMSTFGTDSKFYWAGKAVQALALIVRAGDRNPATG